jgi:hypothetical protein
VASLSICLGIASCGPAPVSPPPLVQLSPVERLDPARVQAPAKTAVAAYVGCYRLAIPSVPAEGEGALWIQREPYVVAQLQASPGPRPSQMVVRYVPSLRDDSTWSLRDLEAWFAWGGGFSGIQFRLDRRGGELQARARYSSDTDLDRAWEVVEVERVSCDE